MWLNKPDAVNPAIAFQFQTSRQLSGIPDAERSATSTMQRFATKIAYHLENFRSGDAGNAFHGLLELDRDILPELMAAFRSAQDIGVREMLVEVIWRYREQSVIPFLREALLDTQTRIWRQALNGLVALASPAALDVLCEVRTRQFSTQRETEEFRCWVEEAISQAETEVQRV